MRVIDTKSVVCPKCGVELDVPLYEVDNICHYGMKFCHQCGAKLFDRKYDDQMTIEKAMMILANEMPSCGNKLTFTESEKYETYQLALTGLGSIGTWNKYPDVKPPNDDEYLCYYRGFYNLFEYFRGQWIGQDGVIDSSDAIYWQTCPPAPSEVKG